MEIINRIRPAIYHLLDGTINEDAGHSSSGIFDYVIYQLYNKEYITFIYHLSSRRLSIRKKDSKCDILSIDHNFKSDNSKLESRFNLIQVSSDNHATSILLHRIDHILYLSTFNSGLNLEVHNKYDNKYSAFICYKIDSKFEEHIFFILSISNFYNNIKNYNSNNSDKHPICLYEIVIWIQYYNNNNILLPNIYFEINNIKIDTPTIFLDKIRKYINHDIARCNVPIDIQIKVTITDPCYYYFFHTILKKIINTNPIEYKFNNDQIRLVNSVKNEHSINEIIFNKLIFYNLNESSQDYNNLYIKPQQSGSCSWFSIYWPLCVIALYNNEYNLFVNLVINEAKKDIDSLNKLEFENIIGFNKEYSIINNILCKSINLKIIPLKLNYYSFNVITDHDYTTKQLNILELISKYRDELINIKKIDNFNNLLITINNINNEDDLCFFDIYIYHYFIKFKFNNINLNLVKSDLSDVLKLLYQNNNNPNCTSNFDLIQTITLNFIQSINDYKECCINNNYNNFPFYLFKYIYKSKNLILLNNKLIFNSKNIIDLSFFIFFITEFYHLLYCIKLIFRLCKGMSSSKITDIEDICHKLIIYLFLNLDLSRDTFIKLLTNNHWIINNLEYDDILGKNSFNFFCLTKNRIDFSQKINYNIFEKTNKYYILDILNNNTLNNNTKFDFNIHNFINITFNFIKNNIYEIYQDKNILLHYKKYFCNLVYNINLSDDKEKYTYIIYIIKLLFIVNDDITNFYYYNNIFYNYGYSIEGLEKIINEIKKNKNVIEFTEYLLDNNIFNINEYYKKIILKNYKYLNIDKDSDLNNLNEFKIDNEKLLLCTNIKIQKIFNLSYNSIIYANNNIILIISELYCIKILVNNNKVTNIFINNCPTVDYDNINYPFKYYIPKSCFHLIYKENDTWKIIYFINNNSLKSTDNILLNYDKSLNNPIIITINKNNQCLPINTNDFIFLCTLYGINKYNIIYFNNYNKQYSYILTDFEYNIIKYKNKNKIFKTSINFKEIDTSNNLNFIKQNIAKLENKIKKCKFNDNYKDLILNKLIKIKEQMNIYIIEFFNLFKDNEIFYISTYNYLVLYNYLFALKILNFITELENNIDDKDFLCILIKIYSDRFNTRKKNFKYIFQNLFEFVVGLELSEEQFNIYNKINNLNYSEKKNKDFNYLFDDKIIEFQTGGGKLQEEKEEEKEIINEDDIIDTLILSNKYPLYHFMMGKGKSTMISPLLALHYILLYNKDVYVIIPSHLKKDTIKIFDKFIDIFNISNKLHILTDQEIKALFLYDIAPDDTKSKLTLISDKKNLIKDSIMLIDEFDTIIDSTKSNFNIKNLIKTDDTINIIYKKILIYFNDDVKDDISFETKLIKNNIDSIKEQLETNKLKENINWGIHPDKGYAIPYSSKSNPMLNSNFISIVMTIYLTLYYYINIKNYKVDNVFLDFIKSHDILEKIFNENHNNYDITYDLINKILDRNNDRKTNFLLIIEYIISLISLSETQINTSFIDIINIDNIFKIGYSGTVNINKINQMEHTIPDKDEFINIEYAINQSTIILDSPLFLTTTDFFMNMNLTNYNAIIDIAGKFKNNKNIDIAIEIHKIKKNVIFIDENNIKYVISNNNLKLFN